MDNERCRVYSVGSWQRPLNRLASRIALELLSAAGFDRVFGARPLKRAIQQQIETPLARENVAGRFGPGDAIRIDAHDDEIAFSRIETSQEPDLAQSNG